MTTRHTIPAINVQAPISQQILAGNKTVETRTYPLPKKYIGMKMAMIETPGKSKEFRSRIVALITFGESFKYASKIQFYSDVKRHRVEKDSEWAWDASKGKWGWPIEKIELLERPKTVQKRLGIVFTKQVSVEY